MRKPVLQNVGAQADDNENEVVFEDQTNPDENNVTPESDADNEAIDAQALSDQEAADLEAAGVNTSEQDDEKARKRQYRALIKEIGGIGAAYGAGKVSMISLAEAVTEAAMKKAVYPDDAEALYDKFRESADAKATIDDAGLVPDAATSEKPTKNEAESRASQLSKLKSFIKLGNKFNDDAGDLIRRARNIHLETLKGDRRGVKKGSTYSILTGIAAQNEKRNVKTENVMTDEEIQKYLAVPIKDDTPPDGAKKTLDALINAKAARNGSKDREPIDNVHLDNAINELTAALGEIGASLLATHEAEEKAKADKKNKQAA